MHHLFLDANIYLDFYRFGADDLSVMQKLVALIKEKEIVLLTNSHLAKEITRNRDAILADSLQKIKGNKFSLNLPKICVGTEVKEIRGVLSEANNLLEQLHTNLSKQVAGRALMADELIDQLFSISQHTEIDEGSIAKAERRVQLGNPPGKRGSLGDAIHWQSLLDAKLLAVDIVSRDGDFGSPLVESEVSSVLLKEWKDNTDSLSMHASANIYSSLTKFFNTKLPNIQLTEEAKKNELIEQLRASPSYAATHTTIAELSTFKNFTNNQVILLFMAISENSQVRDIATDRDVREFYLGLQGKSFWVPDELHETIANALQVDVTEFFFPF